MSLITSQTLPVLTIRENGELCTGNSAMESLYLHSYVAPSGNMTVTDSSNSSINGEYTPNGTHGGETAYEGDNGWIYYAEGLWCWNATQTDYSHEAAYLATNRLATYRQVDGTDYFYAKQDGDSDQSILSDTAYLEEFLTDTIQVGSNLLKGSDATIIQHIGTDSDSLQLSHNGESKVAWPQADKALAINSAISSYTTINSLDLVNETDFADAGSWTPNGLVHVKTDSKTPDTYTNNVVGVTSANTVNICDWEVTSPSEASRYPTTEPASPKDYELWVDPDEMNLKIYVPDSLTDGTVYNNTWQRISYNFPSFKPMNNDAYNAGYKLALSRTAGDLKDYPLNNITVNAVTLNGSASAQLHSGAGFTVNNKIVLTGFEDSGAGGNCAVIDLSDNSYTSIDQTSWNTSNGVVGYDGKTIFLATNIGGCQYFEPNPTSNSDITGVDANGTANNAWMAITCGPTATNTVYGLLYNSSANESYVVRQGTYPSASDTSASYTLNTSTGQLWTSLSLTYTGNIYGLPATENGFVLKIDTTDDSVETINCGNCPAVRQTILAPNGLLYGFPDDFSANVIRFDPSTEEITLLDAVGTTNETRYQGFCGADGKLYIFPDDLSSGAETIIFDPATDTASIVELPNETTEAYLTILPGPPGVFYRLDNQGKYMHIIKFYHTFCEYDEYWKYTHFNSR